MQLTYTLINRANDFAKDVSVPSTQIIDETIMILNDAKVIDISTFRIKSLRNSKYLDTSKSYEELKIYTGDVLELIIV